MAVRGCGVGAGCLQAQTGDTYPFVLSGDFQNENPKNKQISIEQLPTGLGFGLVLVFWGLVWFFFKPDLS